MSFEKCVATYQRLCDEHQHDAGALKLVHVFGQEITHMRLMDLFSASLEAYLAVEKAKQSSMGCA